MIDEKRLAEIRARDAFACELASEGAGPDLDHHERERHDLLAMLDAERRRAEEQYDRAENAEAAVAALHLAIVDGVCDHDERDEIVRQAKRQHDDAARADEMRTEAALAREGEEVATKRAEDAEAKLAALHAAVAAVRVTVPQEPASVPDVLRALDDAVRAFAAVRDAMRDSDAAATRYTREVRAGELRRMAGRHRDDVWHGRVTDEKRMAEPADTIGGYELWEVYDGGETFWMAVREGESAISLLADEHDLSMDDMREAEASRTTLGDAFTKKIGYEDNPGVYQSLWDAFGSLVADLCAGRSATRCVGATVW